MVKELQRGTYMKILKRLKWFNMEERWIVYQITINTLNFTFCCQLSLSPEIRTRIGLKIQNGRLKLDTRKKPLLTEKGIKILETLIMKRQNLSVLSVWQRFLFVMDDTSIFLLGSKRLEVIVSARLINETSWNMTSHHPYLNFPNHESAMTAPKIGVK